MRKSKGLQICLLVTMLALLTAMVSGVAFAADLEQPEGEVDTEEYSYAGVPTVALSITNGTATASAGLSGIQGVTTKMTATVQLQKKVNGTWTTVGLWNASTTTNTLSTSRSFSVSSGTYRVYAMFYAYSRSACEFISATSLTRSY